MENVIDSHTHLEEIADLDGALKRAAESGVSAIVAVGTNLESNKKALEICRLYKDPGYPALYPSIGVHPGDLAHIDSFSAFNFIEENIDKAVALGEIGLDYWYKEARKDGPGRRLQEEMFLKQLDVANKHNKPIVIHSRGAWRDCFDRLVHSGITKAVFHWYSGPEDVLLEIIKMGYFISATPSAEYSPEHRRAIEITPLENMFIETDCPVIYKPESGSYRSEPKDVLRTLKAVAEIKNMEIARVAEKTSRNAIEFFGLNK
ncbi:MAG: hypothetical protein A2Z72_01820 [Omnitrophica bacterium RBG_13_46_9]|nr:MAG: hypothetical protein A2Z72_01820 [Omnitrophica bacterium RBG_13_46_9]